MTTGRLGWLAAAALLVGCASPPPSGSATAPQPPGLPGFGGTFRGTLRILADAGTRDVAMGLDVLPVAEPAGGWTWRLHYGEGEAAQVRDYRLLVDDAEHGRYRIDERNGVELFALAADGELVSLFTVGGQTLVVRYRAVAAGIEFALEAFDPAAATATGGDVKTVGAFARQRALLLRVLGDGP